jgi:hypothetical protein
VPELAVVGPPATGQPGPGLAIRGGLPGAAAQVLVGVAGTPAPLPAYGATLYPAPLLARLPVRLDGVGASPSLFQTPQPSSPLFCGLEFVAQGLVIDPAAQGGAAFTSGVRLRFGAGLSGAGIYDVTAHYLVPGAFKTARPAFAVADLDGNGRPDVVVPAGTGAVSDLRVLRQLSDGTLAPPLAFPLAQTAGAVDVVLADLDDDGVLDAATAHAGAPATSVLLLCGLGDGGFGPVDTLGPAADGHAVALAAGDVTGDGIDDLVVAGWTASAAAVIAGPIGPGPAGPAALIALPAPPVARGTRLGDVDGDGMLDLLVLLDGAAPQVLVARSLGGGAFAPPVGWPVAFASVAALAAGDVDGDGQCDAVVASLPQPTRQELVLLLSDGVGGPVAGPPLVLPPLPGAEPVELLLGDLGGDALPELVVTWGNYYAVSLPNLGAGAFGPPADVDYTGTRSRLADMDGDGRLDLVTLTEPYLLSRVSWQAGDGAGGFELPPALPDGFPIGHARAADLDDDGDIDLVGWPYPGTQTPAASVALNDGSAGFAAVTQYATDGSVRDVVLADMDDDGLLDLVAAGSLGASVFAGRGDGTFGPPVLVGQPSTQVVRAADTDGDGLPELILGSTVFPHALRVHPNLGGLTFGAPSAAPLPVVPGDFDVGDLDGDGFPEAVVQAGFGVLRLDGTGTPAFAPYVAVTDPQAGAGNDMPVLLADVDGDADLDMVRRTTFAAHTEIWLNDGTGALSIAQWAWWEASEPPTVIDVNGDGAPDIVGEGVMLGLGGGRFAEPVPGAVTYVDGDLDGDGRPDGAAFGRLYLNRLP